MATNANWTVVFEDKMVIKNHAEGAEEGVGYRILDDDAFWNQSKFSNIWAIQHGTTPNTDEVEYRDETPHSQYDEATLGSIQEFTNRWDAAHLARLQSDWDMDNYFDETGTQETADAKVARIGARPTSYTS